MRRLIQALGGLILAAAFIAAPVLSARAQDATSPLLQILLMGSGLHQNDWGSQTNTNLTKLESAIAGQSSILLGGTDYTMTDAEARAGILVLTGTLSNNVNVLAPAGRSKSWIVSNQTSGAFTVTIKPNGGSGVTVAQGLATTIFSDGSTARAVQPDLSNYPTASSAMLKSGGSFTGLVSFGASPLTLLGVGGSNASSIAAYDSTGTTKYSQFTFSSTGGLTFGNASTVWSLDGSGNTVANTVSDALGNLRDLPQNAQAGAYTLTATDAGKIVVASFGGVTIPTGVFGASKVVSIVNDSDSSQTITQGSGLTLRMTGQASATGNRTLLPRGIVTIWFKSGSEAYIAGNAS